MGNISILLLKIYIRKNFTWFSISHKEIKGNSDNKGYKRSYVVNKEHHN